MRVRSVLVFSVMALLFVASVAQADDVTLGTYSWVFNQSNYVTTPGGTVTIGVALQETGGGNALLLHGMDQMAGTINWLNSPVPPTPAAVLSVSDIIPNPAFAVGDRILPGDGTATILDFDPSFSGEGTQVSPGVWQLSLGTFTFTAGYAPGVTHLKADIYYAAPMGGGNLVNDDDGSGLDPYIATGYATITTPEPSTFVMSVIAALGFFGLRLRAEAARVAA